MSVQLLCGREEIAGLSSGGLRFVVAQPAHHPGLPMCFVFMLLACAVVHAEESMGVPPFSEAPPILRDVPDSQPEPVASAATLSAAAREAQSMMPPRIVDVDETPDLPLPVHVSMASPMPAADASDHVAINTASIDRVVNRLAGNTPRNPMLHLDDVSTATGFVDSRVRSMAMALDAPLSRGGDGLTLQSRVEMAYRPGMAPVPGNWDAPPGEATATGLAVRLYGSKPTRLNGVYPFVEADWWQDNRAKTININGTRVDTDLLRGLLSFNIGAHSNSTTGLRLWVKARGGKNAGGTVGARYRW